MYRNRRKAFSLIEMLLVLGVLAVILIAAFVVYPKVRSELAIKKELEFVSLVEAKVRNSFASTGNYNGLGTFWTNAKNRKEDWTQSPNGWSWTVQGFNPSTNSACDNNAGPCPVVWLQLYYRDGEGVNVPDEVECQRLLISLSSRMTYNNYGTGAIIPRDAASAVQTCNRAGPTNPLMHYFYFN